ncbi:hypothetical protein [Nocardia sp. NPDC052566]|uniref:hypothetical protein n=1 Tax=Nocardia sp. NPDC052566 TaxID=3364330 RepID=UPI0037C5666F
MGNDKELEARVTALEGEVAGLRRNTVEACRDAATAQVLAQGADRDVSDVRATLRAHQGSMNALRETQIEHGQKLDGLRTEVDRGFAELDLRFTSLESEMRQGFATLHAGMRQITALLTGKMGGEPA